MGQRPYGMLCPISHACELLEPRWTIQILTELWNGSTRFNDIRRGVGNISSGLLSKRLKQLEVAGLVERVKTQQPARSTIFAPTRRLNSSLRSTRSPSGLSATSRQSSPCVTPTSLHSCGA